MEEVKQGKAQLREVVLNGIMEPGQGHMTLEGSVDHSMCPGPLPQGCILLEELKIQEHQHLLRKTAQ